MTIKQIYQLAISLGIKNDFRPQTQIKKILARHKKQFEKLSPEEKEIFDQETLTNPYSDTRILWGDPERKVKKIMVGIDINGDELLLADKIGGFDLVIAHHPLGRALAGLDEVMHYQADILAYYGVPINIAESLLKIRISEVARGLLPINHNRTVDMARLLNIPLMCVHTPTDNLVAKFVEKEIKKATPEYVEDLMNIFKEIPEYKEAAKEKTGPELFAGAMENRCGKIALTEITGGTEGSPQIYHEMAHGGIGTIIGMHMSEKHTEEAKKAHINAVIAGHMSSDSLGMNLFLDELERRGVKIVPLGGLIRISRLKK